MKFATIITLFATLGFSAHLPIHAGAESTHAEPSVEVEVLWTDVRAGKTNIFLLITNPNDFDVYVSTCGSSQTQWTGAEKASNAFGDGPAICDDPKSFQLVPGKSKRLQQWWWEGALDPGPNRFHIRMWGSRDPRLPWNYILIAPRSFNFVIVNPDTLSH